MVLVLADMGEFKDEEMELDLGLSIGGSFRNAQESVNKVENLNEFRLVPDGFDLDQSKSWLVAMNDGDHQLKEPACVLDLQNKREIHASRRQEAKRKRAQKSAPNFCKGMSMECVAESEIDESVCKKEKVDRYVATNNDVKNVNLNLISAESMNNNGGPNSVGYSSLAVATAPPPYVSSLQAARIAYGYGMVQYVPLNNGFGFPCVVHQAPSQEEMKNVVQPVMGCGGFSPFQNGAESGERDGGKGRKAKAHASSSMCSSSVVSDYLSSSHEGGGSSDSRSHSANSLLPPNQLNYKKENKFKSQPEPSVSSNSLKSDNGNNNWFIDDVKESQLPNVQPGAASKKEDQTSEDYAGSNDSDIGKPPKPQSSAPTASPSLSPALAFPQMPYVSTTGNGPIGKTVTGFLYRYTKTEVSIICVCHGSTFSPAEFVQHAGGTDISHPLRHITVIPSAFG